MLLVIQKIECCNLQAASFPNSTGIGFLDHMLDQFHSHAQVGVGIHVIDEGDVNNNNNHNNHTEELTVDSKVQHHNRFASSFSSSQQDLMIMVGKALGTALRPLVQQVPAGHVSRFCCPLDEALVECILQTKPTTENENSSDDNATTATTTFIYDLAPYGIYPKPTGRTHIGYMETQPLEFFWNQVATEAGFHRLELRKLRGDNAHHIVESSFKATARALRNLLDHTNTTPTANQTNHNYTDMLWSATSDNYQASAALQRQAQSERKTKETTIAVKLHLTPPDGNVEHEINTGILALDQFLLILARAAQMSLTCTCQGDVWVDEHHTSEDVAISLGQVLYDALGTKAGLNRMWCAQARFGGAVVEVTMDLSNRPCLRHNLTLTEDEYIVDPSSGQADDAAAAATSSLTVAPRLTVEMFEHVLDSLVVNGRMTVHIVELEKGTTVWERAMATAQAFGTALRYCAMVDCRRAGQTASSKGTLSV